MKYKITCIVFIFIFILTSGFGCKIVDKETQQAMTPVELKYWRVFEGSDAFDEIIAAYQQLHPFVTIDYRLLRYEEYESELIDAMAEDRGPDMFSIHSTWVNKYKNKIKPVPPSITMAYPVVKGTLKKEIIPELRTTRSVNLTQLKDQFIDTVFDDVVFDDENEVTGEIEKRIYGLPLAIDTLVLFYNRDLFNNSSIAKPPMYWNREFQQTVKRLTKLDVRGKIIQSGISLGGSRNIERSTDILALLMMQNGAVMSEGSSILFNKIPAIYAGQDYNPGLEALRFYSDFANSSKEVYSWNAELGNSLEMFISGNLAMMLGYSYQIPAIKASAPKLNFGISPVPQIESSQRALNYANYWVETVSRKSAYSDEAWDFLQFATRAENVKSFLVKTKKPSALREIATAQIEDEDIGIFASQALTAKSWYRGKDFLATEEILYDMIDTAATGNVENMQAVISTAAQRVQQTVY
ncbi:extracellular solute-binding protein [Patescibacteria group bacterium]|nr:extracellular solute-binding protein [Patescibacteria group bacterium]